MATALVALVALVVAIGFASPSSAGGWAIASVDSVPEATAGETSQVGFTILQHGVTPAELTEDVGIEIVHPDATVDFFAAATDGTPGHYVASVQFPPAGGEYTWSIRMGWFGTQDLGTLAVGPSDQGGPGAATSAWTAGRWAMVVVTAGLAAVALTDLVVTRRRPRPIAS